VAEQAFSSTELELYDAWTVLSVEDKLEGFKLLPPEERERFFKQLSARDARSFAAGRATVLDPSLGTGRRSGSYSRNCPG
jgi:hypothetical protein